MHIHVPQSTEKQLDEVIKMFGQGKVVYTAYYTCIHTYVCWYPTLSYAHVFTEEAEGFPLNFTILTAMAPLAPSCLLFHPAPHMLIPARRDLDHNRKKYLVWFIPLGEGVLTPAASSVSLKFRSQPLISDASDP